MSLKRFEITGPEIDCVVAEFYREIRKNPSLAPIFAKHVSDWPSHEAKIASFWKHVILLERAYEGNPLSVHRAAGDIREEMFPVWLELFDAVLQRTLPVATAKSWSALAHRIGRGLRYGLSHKPGPPELRF